MTGKHYNWHKAWRRIGARLVHDSGLAVEFDDEFGGYVTTEDTTETWSRSETARGVPLHDQHARLQRLLREAAEWDMRNPE